MRAANALGAALFIVTASVFAFAQSSAEVARIRAQYSAINERIDAGLGGDRTLGLHHASLTVGGVRDGQQWSAVGTMRRSEEYYFDGEPGTDGNGKNRDARTSVRKIVSSYAGAADLRTSAEYYFDDAGLLIFAFSSELGLDGKTVERLEYFNRNNLIRITISGRNIDGGFSKEHLRQAAETQTLARRMLSRFVSILTN
jgi:hypothetical protein